MPLQPCRRCYRITLFPCMPRVGTAGRKTRRVLLTESGNANPVREAGRSLDQNERSRQTIRRPQRWPCLASRNVSAIVVVGDQNGPIGVERSSLRCPFRVLSWAPFVLPPTFARGSGFSRTNRVCSVSKIVSSRTRCPNATLRIGRVQSPGLG